MHRQHLTEADQQNIVSYIEIRDQNPCYKCGFDLASCCGCLDHQEWTERLKAAEKLIDDIEPQARMLWEKWTVCNNRIDNLTAQLAQEREDRKQLFAELEPYLKRTADDSSAVAVEEYSDTV